jgi:glycosyltransferase involved in cell wall biosynthesis
VKIAYYAATLLEIGGGLEKYFIETAHDLAETPGIQVDVLTMDDAFNLKYGRLHNIYMAKGFDPRLLYREPVETIRASLGKARYIKSSSFRELTRRFQDYDVIYSRNDITEPFFFKFLMGYRHLPPIAFGCHIPHVYPVAETVQAKLHNLMFTSRFYNWLASGVTGFHVINNFTFNFLSRQFPQKHVAKIYYPFNFDKFADLAHLHPFRDTLKTDTFNIVWVGRLVEQKGVHDLVRLIDMVNQDYARRITWNICGDGELKPLVLACQQRWQNVAWWGHVPNQQMASVFSQANLFITTAKWEGYPYNVLESQALGLPAVTYDIPGCQDMIHNGINGFTVQTLAEFAEKVGYFVKGNQLPPESKTHLRKTIDRRQIYADLQAFFDTCIKKRRI